MRFKHIFIAILNMFFFIGCGSQAFYEAQQVNTVLAYDKFLKENADSFFAIQAKLYREQAFYKRSKEKNTVESYTKYLTEYPDGLYSEIANKEKLKLWMLKLERNCKKNEIEHFIETYRNSKYKHNLSIALELLFNKYINKENSFQAYEQFISQYKDVKGSKTSIEDARRSIKYLQEDRTYANALSAYNKNNNIKQLESYLYEFPKGRKAQEAKGYISQFIDSRKKSNSLLKAIKQNDFESVKMLFHSGADSKVYAPLNSPLRISIENGNIEIAKFLLENNADTKEYRLLSAFFGGYPNNGSIRFCTDSYFELFKDIVKVSTNRNKIIALQAALDSTYNYNFTDHSSRKHSESKDYVSRRQCQLKAIKILVEHGVDMNTNIVHTDIYDYTFFTYLYLDYRDKVPHNDLIIYLIENGVPVNKHTKYSLLPIEYAILGSNQHLIEKLMKSEVNIDYTFKGGNTILMKYAKKGDLKVVKKLVSLGANTKIQNSNKKTAYDVALENSNFEIAKYLKNK